MNKRGLLVVVSGPAGSGKSTIAEELIRRSRGEITRIVTATTRAPRPGEKDGEDYIFVSEEEFKSGISNNEYVEYNVFNNNYYGTPKAELEDLLNHKKVVLLVVDINGGDAIKRDYSMAVRLFVLPPTPQVLRERLSNRGTESKEDVEARLKIAEDEIRHLESYDHLLINDDMDMAILDAMSVIKVARAHHIRGGELEAWNAGQYDSWHRRKTSE